MVGKKQAKKAVEKKPAKAEKRKPKPVEKKQKEKIAEKKPVKQEKAVEKVHAKAERPVEKKETTAKELGIVAQERAVVPQSSVPVDVSIVFFPLVTEKAVNMIEAQNKLCFIVADSATKKTVKHAIEAAHNVKVDAVNIVRDMKGRKKAIVKINKKFKADEIAMRLGVI